MQMCSRASAHLREAQLDASLFESAGELLQLLQVAGLLRVRGHRRHRRHAAAAAAHLRALVSLPHARQRGNESEKTAENRDERKGGREFSTRPVMKAASSPVIGVPFCQEPTAGSPGFAEVAE